MRYLFCNARKIDLFMRFHVTITTAIMIIIYKMLNRNGIAYIKLDSNGVMNFEYKNNLKVYSGNYCIGGCLNWWILYHMKQKWDSKILPSKQ